MPTASEISPAEWQVMRVVWTKQPVTSNEVCTVLTTKMDWKPATVKTLLGRLVEKGALTTTKTGRAYSYQAVIPEQETMDTAAARLLGAMCQMHVGRTLAHLVDQLPLTKDDVATLIAILQKKAPTAPDHVPCDCIPSHQCSCDSNCPNCEP